MKANSILLEIFKNRFSSISEEMGVTLYRTAFSPNIKERRDRFIRRIYGLVVVLADRQVYDIMLVL